MIAILRKAVGDHEAGKLPSFTSIGGYPIWYVVSPTSNYQDSSCWCASCCNAEDDDALRVVAAEVNWEDGYLSCENCGERIESAYAEPQEEES